MNEDLNDLVRRHELEVDWEFREVAEVVHRWFDIFNQQFFGGELPQSFLHLDRQRYRNLGHYRRGRNAVGARHEIGLNTLHLDRPVAEVLATLLHEMAHEWQELYGRPGKGGYHNREFTRKCEALGIPCAGGYRSYSLGYTTPFTTLLSEYGVGVDETRLISSPVAPVAAPANTGTSKLKKWRCGCTNIRAAVEVRAECLRCGQRFERKD